MSPASASARSTSASSIRRSSCTSWPIGPTPRSISSIRKMPPSSGVSAVNARPPAAYADFCFQGVVLRVADGRQTTQLSGPDGVVIVDHKEIWAGDGDSKIKVIDHCHEVSSSPRSRPGGNSGLTRWPMIRATTSSPPRTMPISRPSSRCSIPRKERSWPNSYSATTPPTYAPHRIRRLQCVHTGVNAQNGIEQPQWSPETGLFYVSVPQVGDDATHRRWAGFP